MNRFLIAAIIAGLSTALPAVAQTPSVTAPVSLAVIAGRQAGMDLLSAVSGDLKRAVEGKADVKPLKANADAIVAWGKAIPGLFMPGTESGLNTKALPAVWSDAAGFAKAAAGLSAAGEKLSAAAAAEDKAAFADAYNAVGQACGACHRGYRAR
jgi:cytochrome c556